MAGGSKLLAILGSRVNMLPLCRQRSHSTIARGHCLGLRRSGRNSAAATVIAHPRVTIDDDIAIVDIVDHINIYICYRPVVAEGAVIPPPSVVAMPGVPVAIIDAAIEADVRSPIAGVETIVSISPIPVAGRP